MVINIFFIKRALISSIVIGGLLFTSVKLTTVSWTSFADTLDFSSVQNENLLNPDDWRFEKDITSEEEVFLTSQDANQIIGRWPYGSCNTVYAESDYVYIGSGGWVIIVDMTDPVSPVEISRIVTPGVVWKLFRSGDYLYVADKWGGLRIIDVSDTSNPSEIGSFYTTMQVYSVYVLGNHAYVGGEDTQGAEYFSVVDISDPANPIEIATYAWVRALDIYVSESFAYVGEPHHLRIFNISDPLNPVEISSTSFGEGIWTQVEISNGIAFIAGAYDGLHIFNVSDPVNPTELASLYYGEWAWDVKISDGYAYVDINDPYGIVRVLNISNPANPVEIGNYSFDEGYPHQLCSDWEAIDVHGHYAYVTYTYGGLRILNVSDPSNPVKVGFFPTSGGVFEVHISGNYAYIVNEDFHILNISDPSNPIEVAGFYKEGRVTFSVFVFNDYVYVGGLDGFLMFDVSDPTNPILVNNFTNVLEYPKSGCTKGKGIFVSENYAYFLQKSGGLRILDISDPLNPIEVGCFNVETDEPLGVFVSGNYAYVTYEAYGLFKGLRILDVSNHSKPIEVGCFETPEHHAMSVYVSGNYAYLCSHRVTPNGTDIIRIIDVHNPSSPVEISSYSLRGACNDVFVSDGYAYVSTDNGFQIIYIGDPEKVS